MEQMSGQDASFLYNETPNSPMHIGGLMIYDPSTVKGGKQRFKDILNFIEERLHLAKTFRQKKIDVPFSLDYPYWIEDKDFDLEFHVRHIRLPKGSYGIVSKIHHACIDGVSGVDIIEAIHSLEPYPASPPSPEKPWRGEDAPNPIELLTRAQFNNMTQPFRFAEVMAHAIPAITRFQEGLVKKKFEVNVSVPKTRFSGRVTAHPAIPLWPWRRFQFGLPAQRKRLATRLRP